MPVIAGSITYPSLPPILRGNYTCTHGITPGVITLRTQTGVDFPTAFGDVVISQGVGDNVVIANCRLDSFGIDRDSGTEWIFRLSDERWRWKHCTISGHYNRLDPNGKYIPKYVKSPTELAILCLQQMGVQSYSIDMPPGLNGSDVNSIPGFLVSGINFPQIGINPEVNWYGENAAAALASLCDFCGRRIVYDPISRSVTIIRAGFGLPLPDGSIRAESLSVTLPANPDAVTIMGAPTRFEWLWNMIPVGYEWNRVLKPINQLSYAPILPASNQVVTFTVSAATVGNYSIAITFNGQTFTASYSAVYGDPATTVATNLATQLVTLIANYGFAASLLVGVSGTTITVTCLQQGPTFSYAVTGPIQDTLTSPGVAPNTVSWKYCIPPLFEGVRATDRLSLMQARQLAQESVYRIYQMSGLDVTTGKAPMNVPGYGVVKNIIDVELSDTMVQQVVPDKGDDKYILQTGESYIRQLYNGLSKDRAAFVIGKVAHGLCHANSMTFVGVNGKGNTAADTVLPFQFEVDRVYQAIKFHDYVWKYDPSGFVEAANITLCCAAQIRDEKTNQFVSYIKQAIINPSGALDPYGNLVSNLVLRKSDVQLNVYTTYLLNALTDVGKPGVVPLYKPQQTSILESDPISRSDYYLAAELNTLQLKPGANIRYNGILAIPMDGLTQSITWEVATGSGCETCVSQNCENDVWFPDHPARRRIENMAAVTRNVAEFNRTQVANLPGNPLGK